MSNVSEKNHGKIVQVMGPVVDVEFENNDLPFIKDALEVYSEGKRLVMEVAQHIGNNTVRCIMLGASEGLCKDMDVIATGKGIQVPVGKKTLEDCSTYWERPSMVENPWRERSIGSSTEIRLPSKSRALS